MSTNKQRRLEYSLVEGAVANFTGSDIYNDGFPGVVVFININTATDATITATVQGKSPVGTAEYYTIVASSALASTGLTAIRIYPGLPAAADATDNDVIPPTWRITVAITGTVDYDIAYAYLP